MSTRQIKSVLHSTPELQLLTERTKRHLELQHHLRDNLPTTIAPNTAVANFEAGTLVIAVPNGASAAKIRQIVPRLLRKLRHHEPELNAIKVLVQVTSSPKSLPKKRISLGHNARTALLTLSSNINDAALREAVIQLAGRAGPSNNKQETLDDVNSYKNQDNN